MESVLSILIFDDVLSLYGIGQLHLTHVPPLVLFRPFRMKIDVQKLVLPSALSHVAIQGPLVPNGFKWPPQAIVVVSSYFRLIVNV